MGADNGQREQGKTEDDSRDSLEMIFVGEHD